MTSRNRQLPRAAKERIEARAAAKASPTITQVEMIELLSRELGIEPKIPATELEARFWIDGLVDEERRRKRATRPPPLSAGPRAAR